MFNVIIERACGCVRKANMDMQTTVDSQEEAAELSLEMCETMNEDFCAKHRFEVTKVENNFIISMKNNF